MRALAKLNIHAGPDGLPQIGSKVYGEGYAWPLEAAARAMLKIMFSYGVSEQAALRAQDEAELLGLCPNWDKDAGRKREAVILAFQRRRELERYRLFLLDVFEGAAQACRAIPQSKNWQKGELTPLFQRVEKLQARVAWVAIYSFAPYQEMAKLIVKELERALRFLFEGKQRAAAIYLQRAGRKAQRVLRALRLSPEQVKLELELEQDKVST